MKDSSKPSVQPSEKPFVFVVDDEPLLLELASTLLASTCRVKTFERPDEACRAFADANPRPDLLITDFAMHNMNGMELIVECRRIQPDQKILLLSGTVDESVYRDSPVKPNHFMAKPYRSRDFLALVQTLLAG